MFCPAASPVMYSKREVDVVALDGDPHVDQLAVARRRLGHVAELLQLARAQTTKRPASRRALKAKPGAAADALVHQHRRAATRLADRNRLRRGVGRDQRGLGRRQREDNNRPARTGR